MTYYLSPNKRSRAVTLRNHFSPFGNKLIEAGYLSREQMQQAFIETCISGDLLTDVVASITGDPLPPDLIRQYKKLHLFELKILYGVEFLDPEIDTIDGSGIVELVDSLIPIDICRRHKLLPLRKIETDPISILVAMTDPDNLEAQDDLNRALRPKNFNLQRMVITNDDYCLLEQYYQFEFLKEKELKRVLKEKELEKMRDLLDRYG